jgi:asparagine synthase (glutamine-hydrolysing)
MCGITAMLGLASHSKVSAEKLKRATTALDHRGPDGHGHWINPSGRVALGHTRLSIIDLSGGAQPIANEDETIHVVANGEIYDFERIQRDLERRGHRLRTKSDSEVILHLYEEFGAEALQELRGEYAFVLWDEPNQTLIAARDRFGIKPLYYAVHDNVLYFASEAKALFAAGVPAAWDDESFFNASNFILHIGGSSRTLFKGVFQVPAAHYLLATRNHYEVRRYWDVNYPTAEAIAASALPDQVYIDQLRSVLDEAVRLRMRADVPVGCYLSGGIDSCVVLGLAAAHAPQGIRTFTLSFDDKDYDEKTLAQEMATKVGAEFHPIDITSQHIADAFSGAVFHSENLFFNPHSVAKYILSDHVRKAGYKVVMTGEGSDEVFGGYAHFRRDMLLHNSAGQDPEWVRRELAELSAANTVSSGTHVPHQGSVPTSPMSTVERVLGFVPSWLESFGSSGQKIQRLLRDDFKAKFPGDASRQLLNLVDHSQLRGRDPLNQSLYLWTTFPLQHYVLNVLADRMEMAHSVEGRVPFLDHKVAELVRNMPISLKIRGRMEKYVLREATKDVVTENVYSRHKHPFRVPPSTIALEGPMGQLVNDTLRGKAGANLPFIDHGKLVGLLDRIPSMNRVDRTALDIVLMVLLSATILQERYSLSA